MGGVAGRIIYPFDDIELKFSKLKKMLSDISKGKIVASEKTDGANIALSFRDGQATYARNKGDLLALGRTIEDLKARKFAGGDNVKNAYVKAFETFQKAMQVIPKETLQKIFQNGTVFYSTEIQGPAFTNVINYDQNIITIHKTGHKKVNPKTKEISWFEDKGVDRLLDRAVNSIEQSQSGTNFDLRRGAILKLKKLSDNEDLKIAIAKINKAMKHAGVSDNNSIEEYLRQFLVPHLDSIMPEVSIEIKENILNNIFGHEKMDLPKGTSKDLRSRISQFKKDSKTIITKATWPLEDAIHDFSVEMLRGLRSAYILDNKSELKRLRKEVEQAIKIIKGSGNEEAIEILTKQLNKLKSVDNISTTMEGFVFQYDGVTYKFTGNFAPINQILGLFRFGRGKKIPKFQKEVVGEQDLENNEGGRIIAAIPGGFKPPHAGHFGMAKFFADKPEIDAVYVLISPKERSGHSTDNRISITKDVSLALWKLYSKAEPKIKPIIASSASPVRTVYDFMERLSPGDTYVLGQGQKEIEAGDTRFQRAQQWSDKNDLGVKVKIVSIPPMSGGISGTKMREIIASNDYKSFVKYIPQHLSPQEKDQAWNLIIRKQNVLENLAKLAVTKLMKENKDFQKDVAKNHEKEKARIIATGPQYAGSPFNKKAEKKRANSAPAGFGALEENQDHSDSGMISIDAPPDVIEKIVSLGLLESEDSVSADSLHCTLVYLGKINNPEIANKLEQIKNAISKIASSSNTVKAQLGGFGKFQPGKNGIPYFGTVNSKGLSGIQSKLEEEMDSIIGPQTEYGWVPHMTLGYMEDEKDLPEIAEIDLPSWKIDKISLHWGNEIFDFPLNNKNYMEEDEGIEETSAMGAGAVAGAPGMKKKKINRLIREEEDYMISREEFINEIILREYVRKAIKHVQKERLLEKRKQRLEESRIRQHVRSVLSEASDIEDEVPHHSTGINVLEDLLKKIVPILEADYKNLTTNREQRDSFRSHIINAVQNTISPDRARDMAGAEDSEKFISIGEQDLEENSEESLTVSVGDESGEKFIDIDKKEKKPSKEEEEAAKKEDFGIDGQDKTGRNMALQTFDKIEGSILDSYNLLSDEEDIQLFYDYLLTNLKLYFDKFEDELQTSLREPTTDEYEKEKDQQELETDAEEEF